MNVRVGLLPHVALSLCCTAALPGTSIKCVEAVRTVLSETLNLTEFKLSIKTTMGIFFAEIPTEGYVSLLPSSVIIHKYLLITLKRGEQALHFIYKVFIYLCCPL
jgi:hypothetical protein